MKRLTILLSLFCFAFMPVMNLHSQTIDDHLTTLVEGAYGKAYMEGYMQPLSTALGTSLGGALFHRAYTKGFPRFDVGLSAVYVPIPNTEKSFKSPYNIPGYGNVVVPTVFGTDKPATPGAIPGAKKDFFALPVLHANIGLMANLEASVRFATLDVDYLGKLTVVGGALKYGLSDLIPIPMFPLDFSIQAAYHKFTLGEILDAGTFSMNFQTSYSIPLLPFDVYGGVGIDNSSMTVKTAELVSGSGLGDVDISGKNKLRCNAGVSFTLLVLNVHVDYNLGEYNSVAGGVMIVL